MTITDANTCQTTQSVTVGQPAPIVLTANATTNVSCNGGSNASATVGATGGVGGYTYSWAPAGGTAATASGLTAGTYSVTVSDGNTCTGTRSFTVTQPAAALATTATSITNVTCNGDDDGAVTVASTGGTGAYSYLWSPGGETTATLTNQLKGNYSVVTTDLNSCTTTTNVQITEPSAIEVVLASKTPDGCGETPSGTVSVTASGGTGTLVYNWTPGNPTGDGTSAISDLAEGTYSLDAHDANGCFNDSSYDVVFKDDAAPAGIAQSVSVIEDGSKAVTLGSWYSGCQDLVYAVVAAPAHGTLSGTAPALTYTPASGFSGTDAFTFTVAADALVSAAATVSVTVTALPEMPVQGDAPTAASMTVATTVGTPVTFTLSGSDPDGNTLTYVVQLPPQFGKLSGTAPLLTYTPTASNAYVDRFTFVVNNGSKSSPPGTVLVNVGDPLTDNVPDARPITIIDSRDRDNGCSALGSTDAACFSALMVVLALRMRRRKTS